MAEGASRVARLFIVLTNTRNSGLGVGQEKDLRAGVPFAALGISCAKAGPQG